MKNKFYQILLIVALIHCFLTTFSQNIGIGTTTPTEKVDIAGNLKVDTVKSNALRLGINAGIGKILTSDAVGNANWENNIAVQSGNLGFGVWGDCATNGNLTDYYPVTDTAAVVNDNFGNSVSISGNYAIVGNYADDGIYADQGTANIYRYNGGGWELMEKLTDPSGEAYDYFGISVSISGNYAIVGAYADNETYNFQGSASIYQYTGSSWELMEKITDPTGETNDYFGISVSISGNMAIVGSKEDDELYSNQGSACIFRYNGSSWEWIEKITDADASVNDYFGGSVSISDNNVIVGAWGDDGLYTDQGSVSIYQYNGANWEFKQKITDSAPGVSDFFGSSVSISAGYAIVGAYGDDGTYINQGSASFYQYNGTNWVLMQKKVDPSGAASDYFGYSVSLSGNYALVGEYLHDGVYSNQGAASIYQRVGLGWQKLQYLIDPGGNTLDFFGISTAIDSNTKRFLIGAQGYATNSGKAVFGKIN